MVARETGNKFGGQTKRLNRPCMLLHVVFLCRACDDTYKGVLKGVVKGGDI